MDERVRELEKEYAKLKMTVIGGDPDEPGMIHTVRNVVRDMYDQSKGFGVQHRIQTLERDKAEYVNKFQGASWLMKIEWILFGALATGAIIKIFSK